MTEQKSFPADMHAIESKPFEVTYQDADYEEQEPQENPVNQQ